MDLGVKEALPVSTSASAHENGDVKEAGGKEAPPDPTNPSAPEDDLPDELPEAKYDSLTYWNKRYNILDDEFDWLQSWLDISWAVTPLIEPDSRVLLVGCGNSTLGAEMYDEGFKNVVSIDLSEVVISQMRRRYPHLNYEIMDCRDLKYDDASFDLVLDKGMLDTLVCFPDKLEAVEEYKREVYRVLRPNGAHIIISLHPVGHTARYVIDELDHNGDTVVPRLWREPPVLKRICNPRYDPKEDSPSTFAHTLAVLRRLPYDLSESEISTARTKLDPYWHYITELQEDASSKRKKLSTLERNSEEAHSLLEMYVVSLLSDDEEESECQEYVEAEGRTQEDNETVRYGEHGYWDERYRLCPEPFDWLLTYDHFARVTKGGVLAALTPEARVLVLGCGNADFSLDLYDSGCTRVTNVDLSSVVIEAMKERAGPERQKMDWRIADCTDLTNEFASGSFDVTIDKSTMDCLFCCSGAEEKLRAMIAEVKRVLRPGGQHACISLHTPSQVLPVLEGSNKASPEKGDECTSTTAAVACWDDITYFPVPNLQHSEEKDNAEFYYIFVCTTKSL